MLRTFVTIVFVLAPSLPAAATPPQVHGEIEALLDALATSGCSFNRNGIWHPAPDARTHLQRKIEAFERQAPSRDTETLIARAATSSSNSGKPYLVRCEGAPTVESGPWLMDRLKTIRMRNAPSGGREEDRGHPQHDQRQPT